MFVLLFVYVFGGAIDTPGYDYVDYLMPGIIVQTIAFGGFVTALGLSDDLRKGLIDRFRSLPMARSAVLAGRTSPTWHEPMSAVRGGRASGCSSGSASRRAARGRRRHRADVPLRLRVLVVLRWVGLKASSPEAAKAVGFVLVFPLSFASSAFVPVDSMPEALRKFAEVNPFTTR